MAAILSRERWVNIMKPEQNGRHLADNIFWYIFLNEKYYILIKISLNCVAKVPGDNVTAVVQMKAWHWEGDKPLHKPVLIKICDTIIRWVSARQT